MNEKIVKKLDEFFTRFSQSSYKIGSILIRAGEESRGIFYLKEGNVRQYLINKNGEEMTIHIYKPDTFFPMSWAVNVFPNIYYFEAMGDVRAYVASREKTVEFVKKEPEVLFDLLQRVYSGLDGILSRMEYLMSGDARQRLITILLISAKRFGEKKEKNIRLTLKLTHQDLANLAGLSRETVTREMNKLKKKKYITYTHTAIIIQDSGELEDLLAR